MSRAFPFVAFGIFALENGNAFAQILDHLHLFLIDLHHVVNVFGQPFKTVGEFEDVLLKTSNNTFEVFCRYEIIRFNFSSPLS